MMMPPGLLETLRLHLAGTGDAHRGRALARKASLILSADASLVSLSQAGESRDLLTKMSGVAIDLKPLRERTADLLPLLSHFFHEHTGDWSKLPVISPEAHSLLLRYSWPGNHTEVADLANDILPLVKNGTITKDILPAHIAALGAKDAREPLGLSATQRGDSLTRFLHDKLQKRTDSSVKPDSTVTEPAIAKRA
jgi:DNA-binding NtrC family response regulator